MIDQICWRSSCLHWIWGGNSEYPLWWTACPLKTIITSSQSMQSEIRGRVYEKISTNAILTFSFFLIGVRAIWFHLLRLSPPRSFLALVVLSWDQTQDVVRLKRREMWCCSALCCMELSVQPKPGHAVSQCSIELVVSHMNPRNFNGFCKEIQ